MKKLIITTLMISIFYCFNVESAENKRLRTENQDDETGDSPAVARLKQIIEARTPSDKQAAIIAAQNAAAAREKAEKAALNTTRIGAAVAMAADGNNPNPNTIVVRLPNRGQI